MCKFKKTIKERYFFFLNCYSEKTLRESEIAGDEYTRNQEKGLRKLFNIRGNA